MADLVITTTSVRSYGTVKHGIAGGTVTAGECVQLNASGQLVVATDASAAGSEVVGIALNDAAANQPLAYHVSGQIDLGATIAVGKVYVLSTDGGIAPVDDIAGSEYITVVGVGTAADRLLFGLIKSGVAAAGAVT